MKSIVLIFLSLFIINMSWGQREIIDKVVATVGGELVLLSEIEEQHALLEAQNGELPSDARCNVLDNLLAQKLLLNQSKLDSIEVLDEEVEAQMDARLERILTFMNNDVSQFEEYYGQSLAEVKEQMREDQKSQILVERMRGQLMTNISVTPSEVKDFFDKIPVDSLPYFNSEVEIGEIVYKPKVNKEEREKAIKTLEDIRKRIVDGGEDFAELAQKYSDDGSARAGGELGWTKRGKFVQEFEAAAYKLDKEEISPVVESEFGFHLIQLLERRGNSILTRHILVKPEITDNDMELARTHLDSVRMLIENDTLPFSIAVKIYSNEDVQSYNNDGRIVNPATGNTFFEIGDLDPDIYFTIDTMKVEGISAPFEFTGHDGESAFRIVQLQSRSDPHKANLRQDYSKIQTAAIEAKRSEFTANWIKERINSTYIAIDGMYDTCPYIYRWQKVDNRP
ncbi:MAG: peptidylprolyl isomerase [Bacteroidetes bacterium]|nr:peptidylprolyl isomerase [Bacteroidota bacterium]